MQMLRQSFSTIKDPVIHTQEPASTINLPRRAHYARPLLTKMHFHRNTTSPEGCSMVEQTREINQQDYSPI